MNSYDAKLTWYTCRCGAKLQENQRPYHDRVEHVVRPSDDAMTVAEVAQVLGVDEQVVRYRLRNGKLRRIDGLPRGSRAWVLKTDLQRYIRELAKKPEALVQWALTGKMDRVPYDRR